jgi:transcription initiation factor IIE alpha subunit
MKIVDASEVKRQTRKAPATRMIEKIPEGLFTARDMAERFDVNVETIRRLARAVDETGKAKFKAPSKAAKNGELIIWVYTPEDVDELAEYFGERGKPKTTRPRKRSAKKE